MTTARTAQIINAELDGTMNLVRHEAESTEAYTLDPRIATFQNPNATEAARQQAFTDIFTEYFPRCNGFALRLLKDPHEAEDMALLVMTNVYRALPTYRAMANLSTWIFKILKNESINRIRYLDRRAPVHQLGHEDTVENIWGLDPPSDDDVSRRITETEELAEVNEKLRNINPDQLEAMMLFGEGFSYREIAEIQGVEIGTVMSRIHRARIAANKILSTTVED